MLSLTFCIFLSSCTAFALSESLDACEESFVKVGCYKDKTRPLPKLLLNMRNELSSSWNDYWENFVKRLACSCANKTRSKGFTYFGLQYYGECWSGVKPNVTYAHDGISRGCVGQDFKKPCDGTHSVCVGKGGKNYVYKLVTPTSAPDCKDHNSKCSQYAAKGYCVYENVRSQCPHSCKEC